jgi:glycerol-3-phosphate acyltransferase PlsY
MENLLTLIGVAGLAYLIGSIPFGWVIVKISTGLDVRFIESGRTGGTNVMRAAGWAAGAITALLDFAKGAVTVYVARALFPAGDPLFHWAEIAAPLAAILGHNYSIYLIETHQTTKKLRLRGGAGGATCLGGTTGLWFNALPIVLPLVVLVYFVIGYASLTTMSIALISTLVFAGAAAMGLVPWEYVVYGIVALGLVLYALRPNIQRLREGNERIHGLRPMLQKQAQQRAQQRAQKRAEKRVRHNASK